MKRKPIGFLLLAALLLFLPPAGLYAGQAGILLTEEVQLRLADAFLEEGEYYRAVTEYKKFAHLFPESKKTDYALYRIGIAYYRGDEYERAAGAFAAVVADHAQSPYVTEALFREGLSYQQLDRPAWAAASFDMAAEADPASEYARLALIGKALAEYDLDDIDASRLALGRLIERYPSDVRTANAAASIELLDSEAAIKKKSPEIAGLLSALVPGSGHIYAGRYGDGITAFFLNGLFIAGAVTAACNENYAVAGVVGLVGLPFYVGNIYGAANAANKYTIALKKDLRDRIALTLDYHF